MLEAIDEVTENRSALVSKAVTELRGNEHRLFETLKRRRDDIAENGEGVREMVTTTISFTDEAFDQLETLTSYYQLTVEHTLSLACDAKLHELHQNPNLVKRAKPDKALAE